MDTDTSSDVSTDTTGRKGYAMALLEDVDLGDEILEYLARIDATLDAHGARFIVHGGPIRQPPGQAPDAWGVPGSALVVIEFPSPEAVEEWYASPEYQEILPLRLEHSRSRDCWLEGVEPGHRATDMLAKLRG